LELLLPGHLPPAAAAAAAATPPAARPCPSCSCNTAISSSRHGRTKLCVLKSTNRHPPTHRPAPIKPQQTHPATKTSGFFDVGQRKTSSLAQGGPKLQEPVRCAGAGAERPGRAPRGPCLFVNPPGQKKRKKAGPAYVVIPQAQKKSACLCSNPPGKKQKSGQWLVRVEPRVERARRVASSSLGVLRGPLRGFKRGEGTWPEVKAPPQRKTEKRPRACLSSNPPGEKKTGQLPRRVESGATRQLVLTEKKTNSRCPFTQQCCC
jgi:hypothetical protein